jgi:tetratricopeptide (TPR) repeat protein
MSRAFTLESAWAVDTSNGPVSDSEASLLWTDGKKAFEEGRYQDAVNSLQRLVDRYPGHTGYLEAHRYLGRSLQLLGKPALALRPLQDYIGATSDREQSLRARLWLGEAYLELSKPNEAYLSAVEIEKASEKSGPELHAEALFLKTRALMKLGQDKRAKQVLDSVEAETVVQTDPVLRGHLAESKIELKLKNCASFPSPGAMSESQARDQFARRALCLQDTLTLYKSAAESGDLPTGADAGERIFEGYDALSNAVKHPPAPPRLPREARTAAQNKQYLAELEDRLEQDRKKAIQDSLSTLEEWRKKAAGKSATAYSNLEKRIGSLL